MRILKIKYCNECPYFQILGTKHVKCNKLKIDLVKGIPFTTEEKIPKECPLDSLKEK